MKNNTVVFFGREYQNDCCNYKVSSKSYELYLQKVCKTTLSAFDEKWCFLYEIER